MINTYDLWTLNKRENSRETTEAMNVNQKVIMELCKYDKIYGYLPFLNYTSTVFA